jgi:hypothetical protein
VLGGSLVFQRKNQGVRFQVYPWPHSSTKIRESALIHNQSSQKIEGWTDQITYLEPHNLAGSFVRPTHQFSEDAQKSRSRGYNKIKQQPDSGIDQLVTIESNDFEQPQSRVANRDDENTWYSLTSSWSGSAPHPSNSPVKLISSEWCSSKVHTPYQCWVLSFNKFGWLESLVLVSVSNQNWVWFWIWFWKQNKF